MQTLKISINPFRQYQKVLMVCCITLCLCYQHCTTIRYTKKFMGRSDVVWSLHSERKGGKEGGRGRKKEGNTTHKNKGGIRDGKVEVCMGRKGLKFHQVAPTSWLLFLCTDFFPLCCFQFFFTLGALCILPPVQACLSQESYHLPQATLGPHSLEHVHSKYVFKYVFLWFIHPFYHGQNDKF